MVVGGILSSGVFVPFTIAHGPTSYNLEREILGWDMHNWGFLMGTLPPLLVGAGLWSLRGLSPANVAPPSVPSPSRAWRCFSSPR